ncbi:MAG TPA: SPOR domain-containing protein [Gaiellaceae bacterium]|nr:SPOR domain-containing protein [Gaiellaceae bacterium]
MAQDDWRIRIELPDEEGASGFLERLGLAKGDAEELADELRSHRLAVSRDGDTVFVYASSGMQAEQASRVVERELQDEGLAPTRFVTERWLHEEERWDDEPAQPDVEEDLLERGYAPWEVRVELDDRAEADKLADQLRAEGFDVSRTFRYVVAGTADREQAVELAKRVHGHVEPGGELVYEVQPRNPFAVFGGLGG